ncbi:MAG: outer membrane beta-barrel protein, partial [Gammaproteobacteria bacterium]
MRQHHSFLCSLTATLMLAMFSTPALADNGDLYVGGGAGLSFLDPQTPAGVTVEDETDIGGKIYVGYDFPWNISAEVFFALPGTATLSGGGEVDYNNLIGINGLYSWPTTGNGFSGFAKLGIVRADTDSTVAESNSDINSFAGLGGRWGFGRGWALRLEYDYFFKDVQMLTFGVSKRFGLFGGRKARAAPPPAAPASPAGDADGDGVADAADACPGTPRGARVDTRGCQAAAAAGQATSGSVSLDAKGLFAVGSAAVTPQGAAGIQNFVRRLQQQ